MACTRFGLAALLAALATNISVADPVPSAAQAEIAALLERLEVSGCQFDRNGTGYSGAQARSHLAKKLEYLENKRLVETAEGFIELGASASSISGKAYWVKCGAQAPVQSRDWLLQQLRHVRAEHG